MLDRVRGAAAENGFVRMLGRLKSAVTDRWLAFSFTRRFYRQARKGEPSSAVVAAPDMGEALILRAISPRLHALIQLRVASRIGAVGETEQCLQACREQGWTGEQIGTALLANVNGTFSETERLLLRYADDITRTPIDVDPQVVRQLRAHFSTAEMLELTASITYENFRARHRDAAGKLK